MTLRRGIKLGAIGVGIVIAWIVVYLVIDLGSGLSLEAASSLFPHWAITAQISHTVADFTADFNAAEIETIVAALNRFAASHGFVLQEDVAATFQPPDPEHLRFYYTSPRASLSFYTDPGKATLAIVSEPGRNDDLTPLVNEAQSAFAPLGFKKKDSPAQ